MKRLLFVTLCGVAASCVALTSSVYYPGEPRGIEYSGVKIVLCKETKGWNIREDAPLFSLSFADVYDVRDMLNEAEAKEMAKAVSVAIAKYLGSTNAVRVVHREYPASKGTNIVDRLISALGVKVVTDETIPLHKQPTTRNENE